MIRSYAYTCLGGDCSWAGAKQPLEQV